MQEKSFFVVRPVIGESSRMITGLFVPLKIGNVSSRAVERVRENFEREKESKLLN